MVLLLRACPFMFLFMTTVIRSSRMGTLIVTSSAVSILVGSTVVVLASGFTSLGLSEGRMGFEPISVSVLLVEAVKPLIAFITFAVLGAQVAHVTMAARSGMGTMMATSASSLQIKAWRRKSSNLTHSGFYQQIVSFVFFVYWIRKRHACKKQETEESPAHR
jgi:hypothetical protein